MLCFLHSTLVCIIQFNYIFFNNCSFNISILKGAEVINTIGRGNSNRIVWGGAGRGLRMGVPPLPPRLSLGKNRVNQTFSKVGGKLNII